MFRKLKIAGVAALGVIALPGLAAAQMAATATSDLNMRAGPGTEHGVVAVIPGYQQVAVHDCTADMSWCQVSYGGATGWSSAAYLASEGDVAVAGHRTGGETAHRPGARGPAVGAAGGALAGGLIAGPPGAVIGGGLGAVAGAPRGHAPDRVAVAGPRPHERPHRRGGWFGPHAGIAGGAVAGALIGGPPGAIIGGTAGGMLGAQAAGPARAVQTYR